MVSDYLKDTLWCSWNSWDQDQVFWLPQPGFSYCPEPIQSTNHTEHGNALRHCLLHFFHYENQSFCDSHFQVRHMRLYLCLHPVHWRFSSGRWNGWPELHHSCCLHPTPGFSPSDTKEETFPWRPPVHATQDQHNSSALWFAPKNKASKV